MGFNLEVGGYFSIKRNVVSIDGDTFIREDQVVAYCKALLEVFRCALDLRITPPPPCYRYKLLTLGRAPQSPECLIKSVLTF